MMKITTRGPKSEITPPQGQAAPSETRLPELLQKFDLEQRAPTFGERAGQLLGRARRAVTRPLSELLAVFGLRDAKEAGPRIGANLRTLVSGLRERERKLVRYGIDLLAAAGLATRYASTRNDLKQALDFAAGTMKAGKPAAVLAPILDVVGFIFKHPEEARKILRFLARSEQTTWSQKSAWMSAGPSAVSKAAAAEPKPQQRADVVVIGAGLGGGAVARELASAFAQDRSLARDVIVIERDSLESRQHAASFRNAGIVCTVMDYLFGIEEAVGETPIRNIEKALGLPRAEAEKVCASLMQVLRESTARIKSFLAEHGGDVELSVAGSIDVATSTRDLEEFRAAAKQARALGMDWSAVDAGVVKERYGLGTVEGALVFETAGALHPGKLVQALFDYAAKTTDKIDVQYGTSLEWARPAEDGQGWVLETSRGTIHAQEVIDAREAFAPFSWREARYSQIHVIDVPKGEGPMQLGDTSLCKNFSYMRRLDDGKFIVGSGDFPVHDAAKPPAPLGSVALYAAAMFKKVYPDVPFEIEKVWGGVFGVAKDGLPVAGELAKGWRLVSGAGGTGLSYTPAMAEQVVGEVLGRPETGRLQPAEAFSPRRFFVGELRHDLLARLRARPEFADLELAQLRIEIEPKKRQLGGTPPARIGDGVVFYVEEKILDSMNTDVATLFGTNSEKAIAEREVIKSRWLDRQLQEIERGLSPTAGPGQTQTAEPRTASGTRSAA